MNQFSEKNLKLAIALHRLTTFFPEEEILKNQLQEKANEIFTNSYLLEEDGLNLPDDKRIDVKYNLLASLRLMNGFLLLAKNLDFPKKESLEILENEYQKIFEQLKYKFEEKINHFEREIDSVEKEKEPILSQLSSRQLRIIKEIKKNKEMRVGDLAHTFGNRFSPKTFQRELQELMARGLIERTGDYKNTYYVLSRGLEKVINPVH
ncbi:MAG: hypothetical protein HYV52_02745 [Parcubacteria group bacterium]|nr:hypothetical protein [Parcubacteria group bacterium]